MKTNEFDYHLPEELIAQSPPRVRSHSRLLVHHRKENKVSHHTFQEISGFFGPNDLLVFNDTRVIPARLFGQKKTGGKVEVLLIRELKPDHWEAMVKTSKKTLPGTYFLLDGGIEGTVVELFDGTVLLKLQSIEGVKTAIEKYGTLPLPPYIKRPTTDEDKDRYQTVFARRDGAVAAPTAGLHFTEEIMNKIRENGAAIEMITLHVGPGTFQPVRADNLKAHKMHEEYFQIEKQVADKVNEVKEKGGRVISVGTTVVRALESSSQGGKLLPKKGWTDIFIHPGRSFEIVDAMVTNFHLPKSTLFMLVSAFVGTDQLKKVYEEAVREKYRFFSYGDAMLIL